MPAPLSRRHFLTLAGGAGLALGAAALGRADAAAPLPNLPPRGDRRLVAISDLNGSYGSTGYIPQVGRAVAARSPSRKVM